VRAVNVLDQLVKLIVRDCLLVLFEYAPFRFAPKDAEIVRRLQRRRKEQQNK
jgi:hypothetical protein